MTVDAHLHIWDLERSEYSWLTPELGPLHATFTAEQARDELDAAGVRTAVLVQAEDSDRDTELMLEAADRHPWIAGVVGWVQLDDPARAEEQLDRRLEHPRFRGVRHLVHDDPRDDFLDLPDVRASLRRVAEHGLVFDVPDAWPRHLAAAGRAARAVPELTVVVDHLAKPPIGTDAMPEWEAELRAVAALPNTMAKFSGLHLPGAPFDEATVGALLDLALDAFGADRLMYGGDWPMSVPHGGYLPTWQVMRVCLERLAPDERDAVLGGNAERCYLDPEIRPIVHELGREARISDETARNIG